MMKATEARAIFENAKAEQIKMIEEKAKKFCEDYSADIKKRSEIGCNFLTLEKMPKDLYNRVCEIFVENGYTIYKLNFETVQIKW